jgi:hypothetical protein
MKLLNYLQAGSRVSYVCPYGGTRMPLPVSADDRGVLWLTKL